MGGAASQGFRMATKFDLRVQLRPGTEGQIFPPKLILQYGSFPELYSDEKVAYRTDRDIGGRRAQRVRFAKPAEFPLYHRSPY